MAVDHNTDQAFIENQAGSRDPLLELRNINVTFDMSRGTSRVIDDVSLDVERDEVLGIVGESGSGKSMLASSILDAVVDPGQVSGSVRYKPEDGNEVDVLELEDEELRRLRWEEISMVFQGAMSSFNPTLSIKGHFEETFEAHDVDEDEGFERAYRLLSDLYLEPERVLESYPHELSGGMKQRALIALALVLEPEVLIMDEPTAALDLLMQRSILSLLRTLKEEYDLTLLFITHDLPLVSKLADRLCVLYAFQIAEIGATEDIIRDAAHPYTRMLLKATPNLDAPLDDMEPVRGEAPDPVNAPAGCSFHARCPLADDTCREFDPELEPVSEESGHVAACHHADESASAVPFELMEQLYGDSEAESDSRPDVSSNGTATVDGEALVDIEDVVVEFDIESSFFGLFGETKTLAAVDGVNLEIGEKDVVALVGESGCGKTTLGKAAIGLERPVDGSVKYRGQDIWEARNGNGDIPFDDIRRALQIIHQDPGSALNPNKRVRHTLENPLKRWRDDLDRNDREDRIYTLLSHVGMSPADDYAKRFPHQLSGGEKQRVALIRALLMNPDLILADEAISALDVSLRVETMDLLLELQDAFETSFLFISHDLSNARYLSQKADGRIAVMYLGEIVEIGTPERIIKDPKHPYTKVLKWATPNLNPEITADEPPVRNIDIPDPVDPPSGCRFHTRCPEAREVCTREEPELIDHEDGGSVSCFREEPDHEYWDSPELADESTVE